MARTPCPACKGKTQCDCDKCWGRGFLAEEKLVPCDCCTNKDAPHHMTKCARCGALMCSRCLYLPSINSPCHCAQCRALGLVSMIRSTVNEIHADAVRDRQEAPIDSVAFGDADGRQWAAAQIKEILPESNGGAA